MKILRINNGAGCLLGQKTTGLEQIFVWVLVIFALKLLLFACFFILHFSLSTLWTTLTVFYIVFFKSLGHAYLITVFKFLALWWVVSPNIETFFRLM